MLALYRCGRQAEALGVYRETREKLNEELGIEPTPALRELERAILEHDPPIDPPARLRRVAAVARLPRWLRIVAAVGVVSAAAVAVGFGLRTTGGGSSVKVVANSVAVVDPRTNKVVDDIRVGDYPSAIAAGNGSIWVGNAGDNTVQRITVRTRDPSFPNGAQQPLDLAVTPQALWVANGTNFQTKPPTGGGTIERRGLRFGATTMVHVGPPKTLNEWWTVVAADGRSVWAGNSSSRAAVRLDPATGAIVERVWRRRRQHRNRIGKRVGTYAGESGVPQTGGVLSKIDPRTNTIVATIRLGFRPDAVAVANGLVWVAVAPRR